MLSFAFSGIAFDMSFDNHYGWTETVPSVRRHESYTPRFNGRLRGRDILAVGMGKNVHGGESNIADGAIQISTSTAIEKSIAWGMLCYNIFLLHVLEIFSLSNETRSCCQASPLPLFFLIGLFFIVF